MNKNKIINKITIAVVTPLVVVMVRISMHLYWSISEIIKYGWADIVIFLYLISISSAILYWYITTIMDMIKEELYDTNRDK